ncbi:MULTISPECIES: LPS export ABC transporter periplasmic protein LptC [Candidatus Cardinium]|uniref:LPS export ABC transporter periplasmic protein LptC n=1 Tax=Candidatus Cardinium TaxID=273135 RepID=UPI001FAA3E5E|nr:MULTISPECIES: LPS export ABC transporter periplasmic protein LptC [Cardinium]
MIKKNIFLNFICSFNGLLFLFLFAIISWSAPVYAENDLPEEVPLLETTQFELLGTNSGKLRISIRAYEMRQYESGNITLTGGIEIIILSSKSDKGEGPIHIQANRLSYNKEKNLCVIAGNVLLTKPQQQFKINTEHLCYDMNQEVIFTEAPVVIADKEHVLKGSLLRATKDLTRYTVTGPSGTVDIKKETVLGANPL